MFDSLKNTRFKKIVLLIGALLAVTIVFLRETGFVSISAYSKKSQITYSLFTPQRTFNVRSVSYTPDSSAPVSPYAKSPDDDYKCVVSYSFRSSWSPWRWLPLLKFGQNESQIVYLIWIENTLFSCGSIYAKGSQTISGISSARNYADQFNEPIIDKMKSELSEKLKIFKRNEPGDAATP